MIRTVAKLKAPWFGGQAKVAFVKNFRRMKPEHRMTLLNQCLKQMRAEYDLAEQHFRIEARDEDARNADAIRLSQRA